MFSLVIVQRVRSQTSGFRILTQIFPPGIFYMSNTNAIN